MDYPEEPAPEADTANPADQAISQPPAPSPDQSTATGTGHDLTATERGIIALEKRRFRYQGSKEQAITQELGLSAIAYYQQLNTMVDSPRVIAAEPELMNRLRARRDALT